MSLGSRGGIDIQLDLFATETDEKINEAFIKDLKRGSGFVDGKTRIYDIFNQKMSKTETIKLLKDEYGIGGRSVTGYIQWHNSKGIKITLDKVENGRLEIIGEKQYTWSQVYDSLFNLIKSGEYM